MGYDMYTVNEMTEAEQAEYDAARQEFLAAVTRRDALPRGTADSEQAQKFVEAAAERMDKAHVSYFRLNIHGMGRCRELMAELGMLKDDVPDPTPFPDIDDAEYDAFWDWEEAQRQGEATVVTAQTERFTAWRNQREQRLSEHLGDQPGIAFHKLCSNDGWLVTPGEAMSVPGLWRKLDEGTQLGVLAQAPWFNEWVTYCARAAERGGFRVY
jgi:hypothetical protein